MERLARLVMHHRRIVSAFWLLLFLGGLFSVSPLERAGGPSTSRCPASRVTTREQQLIDIYGVSTVDTYVARRHGAGRARRSQQQRDAVDGGVRRRGGSRAGR